MSSGLMNNPVVGTAVLKRINTARVLEEVRGRADPARISEIAAATQLTRPTVAQIVEEFLDRGWAVGHDPSESLGRPALRIAVNPAAFHVVGLDIGTHRIAAEVSDARGATLATGSRRHALSGPREIFDLCGEVIAATIADARVDARTVRATTVATLGIVEGDKRRVRYARAIQDWTELDLAGSLDSLAHGAISIENDANLAARAMRDLPGTPSSFLAVQWGERLGAGLVLGGQVFRGMSSAAGEIGDMRVTDPWSGQIVGLEELVGSARIGSVVRDESKRYPWSALALSLDEDDPTEAVFRLAAEDDPLAAGIVGEIVGVVANVLAPICLALDLDRVFITGGIARAGSPLVEALGRSLTKLAATPIAVEMSPLAENTVVRGAVANAVDVAWKQIMQSIIEVEPESSATA
jgi:predicted NBD/HSP70 family sugar kinase